MLPPVHQAHARRLRLYMLAFCVALTLPLGYLILRTHQSMQREEAAELRYFAETLFNEMEEELALLVQREEARPIADYGMVQGLGAAPPNGEGAKAPTAPQQSAAVVGYLQNNPDGGFLAVATAEDPSAKLTGMRALNVVNESVNARRRDVPERVQVLADHGSAPFVTHPARSSARLEEELFGEAAGPLPPLLAEPGPPPSMADRYLDPRGMKPKARLGGGTPRFEPMTREQLMTLEREGEPPPGDAVFLPAPPGLEGAVPSALRAEVEPMQSLLVEDRWAYVYRRIFIDNRVYRQGFVLDLQRFLEEQLRDYFAGQPMAGFTALTLSVREPGNEPGRELLSLSGGAAVAPDAPGLTRSFGRPFAFFHAALQWEHLPLSEGRRTLAWVSALLALVVLAGLLAIYRSTQLVLELSERRAGFVASVTHELKTPLTTIALYAEMLEQGMVRGEARQREYFRTLGTEAQRLSRLIGDVLEFARLERRQRSLRLEEGDPCEVLAEAERLLAEPLRLEGFSLRVERPETPLGAVFDRDLLLQILRNLVENSVKFGKHLPRREIVLRASAEPRGVRVTVADTGPGIPPQALKKVFEDFYRVDNGLTRETQGTGLGLALVRRFAEAMRASVQAENNPGGGCSISVLLPRAGS